MLHRALWHHADSAFRERDNFPAAAAADMDAAGPAERVWTIGDLQILHQLQSPVFVAAFGVYSVPHMSECCLLC